MTSRSSGSETPLDRARAIALRQLATRMRTAAQVRARLAKDGLQGEADEVIAWLGRLGYLDDAAYARARARMLVAPGRLGPLLAERRLAAEGIEASRARDAVAAALAEQSSHPDPGGREPAPPPPEEALYRALAERRARGEALAALDDRARSQLARFLLGRGFSGAVVSKILGLWQDGEA